MVLLLKARMPSLGAKIKIKLELRRKLMVLNKMQGKIQKAILPKNLHQKQNLKVMPKHQKILQRLLQLLINLNKTSRNKSLSLMDL